MKIVLVLTGAAFVVAAGAFFGIGAALERCRVEPERW